METSEFLPNEFLEEFLSNCNHSNYYVAVEELNVSFKPLPVLSQAETIWPPHKFLIIYVICACVLLFCVLSMVVLGRVILVRCPCSSDISSFWKIFS